MKIIIQSSSSQYEVKKSKFISIITSYDSFHKKYKEIKDEHPKANHIVYAYRYVNEFNQIVENFSDDHEPKGCAGNPTLKVLQGENIVNVIIFTIRYFGGIKLGTGGMSRAYANSAKNVISNTKLQKYIKLQEMQIYSSYKNLEQIKYNLIRNSIQIENIEYLQKSVKLNVLCENKKIVESIIDKFNYI